MLLLLLLLPLLHLQLQQLWMLLLQLWILLLLLVWAGQQWQLQAAAACQLPGVLGRWNLPSHPAQQTRQEHSTLRPS